jgi:glucose-1-phosphate thymidylyltransferase
MKALVLAGGTGTRLRPFSHSTPKQLVPVANKPVLFHVLDTLRMSGVTETGVIVSAPGDAVRSAAGDGSRFGMKITYLPQDEPRGLAHCVMIARDFLADDDFVMYLADNIFADGIAEPLLEFQETRPAAQLLVTKVPDPSEYGIAELDESGRVLALQEKPARPKSDLAVTGAYFFTPDIHEAVRNIQPSWRNEWEITDAIQWLVTSGQDVRARLLSGFWQDTGTLDGLLDCNKVLLERVQTDIRGTVDSLTEIVGPVIVEEGARLERSMITGPAIIGAGCTVLDSRIGPYTSLASGCRIEEAGIAYSILLDQASVVGMRSIERSIIGRSGDVRVARDGSHARRLLIGDHSEVEVPA